MIDWLSFTLELPVVLHRDYMTPDKALTMLADHSPELFESKESFDLSNHELLYRRPYGRAIRFHGLGLTIAFGKQKNCLYEFSGVGCKWLMSQGLMSGLMLDIADRATRIDFAADLKGDNPPADIVARVGNKRIKTTGHVASGTGETHYLGSRKSERYARVYRYHEPHPRAGVTRVEAVLRGPLAVAACKRVAGRGQAAAVQAAIGYYDIEGMEQMSDDQEIITAPSKQRTSQGTVTWLIRQAAPAFRRLVDEGVIDDPEQFFREWFLAEADEGDDWQSLSPD